MKNHYGKILNKKNNYNGKASINFSGSKINAIYKIVDKLITLNSEKSILNNNNFTFKADCYNIPISLLNSQ